MKLSIRPPPTRNRENYEGLTFSSLIMLEACIGSIEKIVDIQTKVEGKA